MFLRLRPHVGRTLLNRSKLRAIPVLIALCTGLFLSAQPAHAEIVSNGACTLDVTFTFTAPPTVGGTVGYTVRVNPLTSSCTMDSGATVPADALGSAGAGNGGTSVSGCGVLGGIGPWSEGFAGYEPTIWDGTHVVAGTWLGATMYVNSTPGGSYLNFNSVILLTPSPSDPTGNLNKMKTCEAGGTVTSIKMLGVQVFNDPPL